jgi:hypothetical protein
MQVTLAQVRAAWKEYYGQELPDDCTYQGAGNYLWHVLGKEEASKLFQSFTSQGTKRAKIDSGGQD